MVPVPVPGAWHDEQIDELFTSLLGKGFEDVGINVDAPVDQTIDLGGFRIFGYGRHLNKAKYSFMRVCLRPLSSYSHYPSTGVLEFSHSSYDLGSQPILAVSAVVFLINAILKRSLLPVLSRLGSQPLNHNKCS
jgi:hypothetical protein